MGRVKTERRGSQAYHRLVQSYRWEGALRRKEIYLGTTVPANLQPFQDRLENEISRATWFPLFDRIKAEYQRRLHTLPKSVAEKERRDFVVAFTYDTNKIEGSRLTFEETRQLLRDGATPASKPIEDVIEARKHADLARRLIDHPEVVDLPHLLRWHRDLFGETKSDIAGRLRDFEVVISNSQHLPPPALEVRPLLVELLRRTSRNKGGPHPVERAADFHFWFENIHPFGDGNGRIGRLAMNVLLAQAGFPMLNITYTRRAGYYSSLEESSIRNTSRPFLRWFYLRYRRANSLYLRTQARA